MMHHGEKRGGTEQFYSEKNETTNKQKQNKWGDILTTLQFIDLFFNFDVTICILRNCYENME